MFSIENYKQIIKSIKMSPPIDCIATLSGFQSTWIGIFHHNFVELYKIDMEDHETI